MTDDRPGRDGAPEPESDDASDWLAAQFDRADADGGDAEEAPEAEGAADAAPSDAEPGAAEPVVSPDPEGVTTALTFSSQADASPTESPRAPLPVPPPPTVADDVPRSSGHPMALDLGELAGAVPPEPAPEPEPAPDPELDSDSEPGPDSGSSGDRGADAPGGAAPGPFTALLATGPGAGSAPPAAFDWEALPPATTPAGDERDRSAPVDSDDPEEARVEPDPATRALEVPPPATDSDPEPEPDLVAGVGPEPQPEAEPAATAAGGSAPEGAAEPVPTAEPAPWWVEEHHEMTRRERRLAEAAGLAVPPAGAEALPVTPVDSAPREPVASSVAEPLVVEPSFTEILGIVPVGAGAPGRDEVRADDGLDDVPGEPEADAGRRDPVVEEVPDEVDRIDAETLDGPRSDDVAAGSWSLSALDEQEGEGPEATDALPERVLGDDGAPPSALPASGFPEPYRPPVATSAAPAAGERARTAPADVTDELPGLSFGAGDATRAAAPWVPPTAEGPAGPPAASGSSRAAGGLSALVSSPRGRFVLFVVGAAVVVVLALVALFFLGRSIFSGDPASADADAPAASEPAAAPTTVTAAPEVVEEPVASTGTLGPGSHPWSDLRGGECFSTFENAWQQDYDVVDCATPHVAQLASRGVLPGDPGAPWPGSETLQNQMTVLCTSPEALDLTAAGAYPDVQFVASWPVTAVDWDAGDRAYSCFVSRSSGEPFTTSLAPAAG